MAYHLDHVADGAHQNNEEKIIMNKSNTSIDHDSGHHLTLSRLTIGLALCFASYAHGAPVGGNVVAGSATISADGSTTTISQSTPNAIINWQGFSVGPTESVQFVQPSSSAVTLNRVTSANPSHIQGAITANGQVFLINPNGILFGPNSQVNVGGMVASTLNITDADFMAGQYTFKGDSAAEVINQGAIQSTTDGGYVALLGAQISNDGLIVAQLGTVALAAGSVITLDVAGDNLLNVTVDQGAIDALVRNGNLIKADGGQVLMTARGAGSLLTNAVNNTGVVQAQSIQSHEGTIRLSAGPETGTTTVSGTLDASGTQVGQTGGTVEVLGQSVNITDAKIDVSGQSGGGQVVIGGNFQGKGPQPNARNTTLDSTSVVSADATGAGDGGRISVWSDEKTVFAGSLSAQGGPQGGDGGFVETSGAVLELADTASVNTLAPQGETGMWLLDPVDWTIATVGGDETPAQVATSLATSDRTIMVDNDINVDSPVTWSTSQNLTLDAGRDINVNASITASTAGAQLILIAGNDVLISDAITASGAGNQINITAVGDITSTAAITASEADTELNMTAGQDITVGTVTTDGGGSMVLRADRNVTIDTASAAAGTGTVSLYADNDGTGPGAQAGTVVVGTGITAVNTIIRFNPVTYSATSTEVAAYEGKIVGASDIKAWVFTQADNKVYDTTTTASLSFKGTPTDASAVTLVPGTATFDTKDVGDSKTVTYDGYSLGGVSTDLALYSADGTDTASITPAQLTVSATGQNKVYDATTDATVVLAAEPLAGDSITLANTDASFDDKNVGTDKTVSVSGITLGGADAGNYVANTTTATTADITPAVLLISATGDDKVFDGTTTATVSLTDNRLNGDVFTSSYSEANFDSSAVGNDQTIAVTGIATTGTDAENYTYNTTATTFANITEGISPSPEPSPTPEPSPSPGPTPIPPRQDDVTQGVLPVVPVTPITTTNPAPIVLQKNTQYGGVVATPIVPFALLGTTAALVPVMNNGFDGGPAASTLFIGPNLADGSDILSVLQAPQGPHMLSLYPQQLSPYVAPVRAPRQGRN